MVALLPATATVIGVVVLAQMPSATEVAALGLVIAGVAIHREPPAAAAPAGPRSARRRGRRKPAAGGALARRKRGGGQAGTRGRSGHRSPQLAVRVGSGRRRRRRGGRRDAPSARVRSAARARRWRSRSTTMCRTGGSKRTRARRDEVVREPVRAGLGVRRDDDLVGREDGERVRDRLERVAVADLAAGVDARGPEPVQRHGRGAARRRGAHRRCPASNGAGACRARARRRGPRRRRCGRGSGSPGAARCRRRSRWRSRGSADPATAFRALDRHSCSCTPGGGGDCGRQ